MITDKEKSVLFLCTGNYYRSRIAEELFNYLARQTLPEWKAYSRGLRRDMSASGNEGPISVYTVDYLESIAVPVVGKERYPLSLTEKEVRFFSHIIAMYDAEHRPMVEQHFPLILKQVTFWDIKDIELEPPESAIARLHNNVEALVESLKET